MKYNMFCLYILLLSHVAAIPGVSNKSKKDTQIRPHRHNIVSDTTWAPTINLRVQKIPRMEGAPVKYILP